MTLQYWLGVVVYVVPLFPLAYVWHLKTFKPAYDRYQVFREDVIVPFGLVAMTIQGLFFSWLFPQLFPVGNWVLNGLTFALLFGVVGWSFQVAPVAAKYRMGSVKGYVMLETAFTAVQFLVTGMLLAFVYRA